MADVPPSPVKGRMVAVILLLAIALTVVLVIHWTKSGGEGAADTVEAPAADPQPLSVYLARADLARGEAVFQRCAPCHTIAPGGPAFIGRPIQQIADPVRKLLGRKRLCEQGIAARTQSFAVNRPSRREQDLQIRFDVPRLRREQGPVPAFREADVAKQQIDAIPQP